MEMTPEQWIVGGDTGISSKTIWSVMMGVVQNGETHDGDYDIPYDPSDFGRCYRLLEAIPEWKERLHEVADIFPMWGPIVREWDNIVERYEEEKIFPKAPRTYDFMQSLIDECRVAGGWKKTGRGSWERGDEWSIELGDGMSMSSSS